MPIPSDADAFLKLWTQHEPQIRGCVLLWIPDWNDAQDVAQEVSMVLWKKFDQFQPGTSFVAWAISITKLEAKSYWKRQSRDRRLFTDEFVDIVAEDANLIIEELDQRRSVLKWCMERLKPQQREILAHRYLQGSTVEEIARRMDRSVDAIYKSIARLRSSLVECVGRHLPLKSRK